MGRLESSLEPSGWAFDGGDESYVFTTVRWDPTLLSSEDNTRASCNRPSPFYMLEHHWTRLQVAKWHVSLARSSPAELLTNLQSGVQQWHARNPSETPESLRVKLRIYKDGKMSIELIPVDRIPLCRLFPTTFGSPASMEKPGWTAVLDDRGTEKGAATMYKTNERAMYERARSVAGITSFYQTKEVLLWNTDDEILDGSISTPYFWRNGRWITPASWSGGQQGTTRRWALERGLCVEDCVKRQEMKDGEIIYLSNAVRGYFPARYTAKSQDSTVQSNESPQRHSMP